MKSYTITPALAPAPRVTLWVPMIAATVLSLIFLVALMILAQ